MNSSKYMPGNKLVNAYAPVTAVVVTPITFEDALYNFTTTLANASSPPSCSPFPLLSTHVKSPMVARLKRPASTVMLVCPLVSA